MFECFEQMVSNNRTSYFFFVFHGFLLIEDALITVLFVSFTLQILFELRVLVFVLKTRLDIFFFYSLCLSTAMI